VGGRGPIERHKAGTRSRGGRASQRYSCDGGVGLGGKTKKKGKKWKKKKRRDWVGRLGIHTRHEWHGGKSDKTTSNGGKSSWRENVVRVKKRIEHGS